MQNQNQANAAMLAPSKVKVTSKEFGAKFKSKREVYNFLSIDVGVYLPHYGKQLFPLLLTSCFLLSRPGNHLLPQRPDEEQKEK